MGWDGWLANFMSFSKEFQSFQDDGRLIMKAVGNGTPSTVGKISTLC